MMERTADSFIGRKASELDWSTSQTDWSSFQYPWQQAMREGEAHTGVSLRMKSSKGKTRMFVVNGTPILDAKGQMRGALATFDDVSEIEKKNGELEDALTRLSRSGEAIERKNKELEHLAKRDPLTSLLNRSALFELLANRFENAKIDGTPLSALMVDIDNFKSVNDRFGHAAGDQVIQFVAKKLMSSLRFGDLSARYGGEEFCLILPGSDLVAAAVVAERLRASVSEEFGAQFSWDIDLTISFGVASLQGAQDTMSALLNRADKALHAAKANGRNRVVKWGDPELDAAHQLNDTRMVRASAAR